MRCMPSCGRRCARVGAEAQIFFDRQPDEGSAPFRNVGDAQAGDLFGRAPFQPLPGKQDLALAAHHAADRPQRGRFARAIGAEQHGHAAFFDRDIDPMQHLGLAVKGLDRAQLQDRRHQCRVPR